MPESWATFGTDLHLELAGRRGHTALERALRAAVQTGRLHPGTRLPSTRALAHDLGIARNTIVEAYGQLVAEGWLTAVTGSGTRVADRIVASVPPAAPAPASPTTRYDLRPGQPDLSTFPRTAWLTASRRALHAAPTDALGYAYDTMRRFALRMGYSSLSLLKEIQGLLALPEIVAPLRGQCHSSSRAPQ